MCCIADCTAAAVGRGLGAAAAIAEIAALPVQADRATVRAHIFEQAVSDLRRRRPLDRLEVRLLGDRLQAGDRKHTDAENDQGNEHLDQRKSALPPHHG